MNRLKGEMGKVVMSQHKSDSIVVTGLGMISSIGRDVLTSCASARAGITRLTELDFEVLDEESAEMAPIKGHIIKGFTDGFGGLGCLVRLGAAALGDLIKYAGLQGGWETRTAIFVHVGDNYYDDVLFERGKKDMADDASFLDEITQMRREECDQRRADIQGRLIAKILELNNVSITMPTQSCAFGGPAAFVEVLIHAIDLLKSNAIERCILGGIDSFIDGQKLETLYHLGLIQSVKNPNGFFPGEAAAFVLLETCDSAKKRQSRTEAIIESPAIGKESFHRFSNDYPAGKALSQVIASSFAGLTHHAAPYMGLAVGNLNGDSYRAKDFGNALLCMAIAGIPRDFDHWYPASSFGEIGAATGPVSICLAVSGLVKGYSNSQDILIWLSSDDGTRGAFFVRNINQPLR